MIEIRNTTKKKLNKKRVEIIAKAFFKKYKVDPNTEISLAIVSDFKMKEINSLYRAKDKTTDVLSFPELNEIIISMSQIEKQAKENGHRASYEFEFILVHGLLHLVGYSDESEKDRLKMIKLGEEFLEELKCSNFSSKIKKAFTLIEMMIVLFIVALISALVVANYNVGYSASDLINSQDVIQQNLKLAQSYALSSKPYNDVVPIYWGMLFSASDQKITFFADLNGNYLPDDGEFVNAYGGKIITLASDLSFRNSFDIAQVSILFSQGSGEMVAYDSDSAALNHLEWQVEIIDKHFNIGKLVNVKPGYLINMQNCSCSDSSSFCCSFCASESDCVKFEWVCGDVLTDSRDGQKYPTVQIGPQCWMSKNMNYDNGCSTKNFVSGTDTGWCSSFDNEERFYQFSAAMNGTIIEGSRGICPEGWHVFTTTEWGSLISYLSSNGYYCSDPSNTGKSLVSKTGWFHSDNICAVGNDTSSNNRSEFNASPVGELSWPSYNTLDQVGQMVNYWTSTFQYIGGSDKAQNRGFYYDYKNWIYAHYEWAAPMNVRCIKD